MEKKRAMPFGLLFEEPIVPSKEIVIPIYDEVEDISVVVDEDGVKRPFVEWSGNLGTKTLTHVESESTDDDEDLSRSFLGTKTLTAVEAEQTDEDDDIETIVNYSMLGTKTATKSAGEESDDDD